MSALPILSWVGARPNGVAPLAPQARPIVVLGAGYGGLAAARALGRALSGADARRHSPVVLVDRGEVHELKPKIPEAVGEWTDCDVEVPIRDALAGLPVTFQQTTATGIDLAAQIVTTESGPLPYWRLVWALGALPDFAPQGRPIPGLEDIAIAPYSRGPACRLRRRIAQLVQQAAGFDTAEARRPFLTVVVAGGGFVGVELAGQLADRLALLARRYGLPASEPRVLLVEPQPAVLGCDLTLGRAAVRMLRGKGVEVRLGVALAAARPDGAVLGDGTTIPSRTLVWAGGVRGLPLAAGAGFTLDDKARIMDDATLRAAGHPAVYAIGDGAAIAALATRPDLAGSGQAAAQQGEAVARAILDEIAGRQPQPYRPHNRGMVVQLGHRQAIARLGPFAPLSPVAPWLKQAAQVEHLWRLGGPRLVAQHWGSTILPLIAAGRVQRNVLAGDAPQ